jgi:hypothetical protein
VTEYVCCAVLCVCVMCAQPSLPAPGGPGSDGPVVMCVTDDEVNHIVLEGILQSQNYRCVGCACK